MDVTVEIQQVDDVCAEVLVNHSLAQGYVNALHELAERYGIRDDLTASALARYPDILTVRKAEESEDKIWASVRPVLREAADRFVAMREAEGARLTADVQSRMRAILTNVGNVEKRSPQTVEAYKERLLQRINELVGDVQIDPQRILTEAAIFADRIAVAEETVRIRSHIAEMT